MVNKENVLYKTLVDLKLKTKKDWFNIVEVDKKCKAEDTVDTLKKYIAEANVEIKNPKKNKTSVTIGVPKQRNEEIIERLILLTNQKIEMDKKWENQVPIYDLNKASHIDLKYETEKELNIIELKQWPYQDKKGCKSANTPIHAAIEAVKNYFAYEKKSNDSISAKDIIFTVLAPVSYYEFFKKTDGFLWDNFRQYLEQLSILLSKQLNKNVRFEIKQINLEKKVFDNFIQEQICRRNKENKVDLKNCLDSKIYKKDIEPKLKKSDWIDVIEPVLSESDVFL